MGHMYAFGAELARHALRQRPQRVFSACECGKTGASAQARRGTGEQDRALAALTHRAGGFPAHQKPRQAHISHTLR